MAYMAKSEMRYSFLSIVWSTSLPDTGNVKKNVYTKCATIRVHATLVKEPIILIPPYAKNPAKTIR